LSSSSDPEAKAKLVKNERVKLTATALNNAAVATAIASVVAPTAADVYGMTMPKTPYWWVFALLCLIGSAALHAAARLVLGNLEP